MSTKDVLNELYWRELVHDITPGLNDVETPLVVYSGFDPTSNSLHVGNLVPLIGLVRFQRMGHTPIALIGGGTGLIGDPSGKATERQLLDINVVSTNVDSIGEILKKYLDFDCSNQAQIVNNFDWLNKISTVEFFRDVGKHFSINSMLGKESVNARLESGISFTEFSYMLLQSYDYLKLYDKYACTLQIGGSDQWGNITAGVDFIRRTRAQTVYGLTFPLVTKTDGTKFGKTEQGAIWLTEDKTSVYEFYQFWFNTNDHDVIKYLKSFTFLSEAEISEYEQSVKTNSEERLAQKKLAFEVTSFIHGRTATDDAIKASRILFGEKIIDINSDVLLKIFKNVPSTEINPERFISNQIAVIDLLVISKLVASKSEARRAIEGGGIYFNNVRVTSVHEQIFLNQFVDGQYAILRKGSKNYHLIKILI